MSPCLEFPSNDLSIISGLAFRHGCSKILRVRRVECLSKPQWAYQNVFLLPFQKTKASFGNSQICNSRLINGRHTFAFNFLYCFFFLVKKQQIVKKQHNGICVTRANFATTAKLTYNINALIVPLSSDQATQHLTQLFIQHSTQHWQASQHQWLNDPTFDPIFDPTFSCASYPTCLCMSSVVY